MKYGFEELDHQETPLGDISLRRRAEPRLQGQILYEVKMNDEYLMSSLFTEAEIQLSKLGLAGFGEEALDVVVGGLGLGYTAVAALECPTLRSLLVVDVMKPVIEWHQKGLVPLGEQLCSDKRCQLVHADFFHVSTSPTVGFDGTDNNQKVHAVLLDIDHSPSNWLNPGNGDFYTLEGLRALAEKIHPGGVFGLWSNDLPDENFVVLLNQVFAKTDSHVVDFPNPYSGETSNNSVYVCHTHT